MQAIGGLKSPSIPCNDRNLVGMYIAAGSVAAYIMLIGLSPLKMDRV